MELTAENVTDINYTAENYQRWRELRLIRVRNLRDSGMKWKEIAAIMKCTIGRVQTLYMYEDNMTTASTKEEVKIQYAYRCGLCTQKGEKFDIHHIGSPSNREHENLMPLCRTCHVYVHKVWKQSDEAYESLMKVAKGRIVFSIKEAFDIRPGFLWKSKKNGWNGPEAVAKVLAERELSTARI